MSDLLSRLRAGWIKPLFTPVEFAEAAYEIESLREEVGKWSGRYYSLWSNVGNVNDCTFTDWAAEVNEMYREEE